MFSLDSSDRPLPPSDRRRREARSHGQVARSHELSSTMTMLAGCGLIWYSAAPSFRAIATILKSGLSFRGRESITVDEAANMLRNAVGSTASLLWPLLVLIIGCGLVVNLIQTGWLWVPALKWPAFRPLAVLSGVRCFEAVNRLFRIVIVTMLAWRFWNLNGWKISSLNFGEANDLVTTLASLTTDLCLPLSACLVTFSLIDYGIRYWQNERALMMTVEERRREQRDDSIKPEIKQSRSRES